MKYCLRFSGHYIFPLLIVASQKYLGVNSRQIIKVTLSEDDDEVLAIKGMK
jgi:hypothetical protein